MNSNTLIAVRQYFKSHNVLCLATTKDNQPWVSPVFYATGKAGLIFLSAPHTRHCKNIAENANVSASIQREYIDWNEIKGLQIEGNVVLVSEDCKPQVIECYSAKFPVTGDKAPPAIANALDKIQWFQLNISKLFYIDNAQGLGHREQIDPALLFCSRSD